MSGNNTVSVREVPWSGMAQSDLLLALQILLDHDGLTEEAHTQTLFSIAQLLGGFEHLGVCAHLRLPPLFPAPG